MKLNFVLDDDFAVKILLLLKGSDPTGVHENTRCKDMSIQFQKEVERISKEEKAKEKKPCESSGA